MPRRRSAKRRSVRRTSKCRSARRSARRSWRPWAFGEMPERNQVVGLPAGTMADWYPHEKRPQLGENPWIGKGGRAINCYRFC